MTIAKDLHLDQIYSDSASLSRKLFILSVVFVVCIFIGWALWSPANPETKDPVLILISVASSILASMIFYILYSSIAEERVLRNISNQAALMATEHTKNLFHNYFEKMMPIEIYPETHFPGEAYKRDFWKIFKNSRYYMYKGDVASFASYTLDEAFKEGLLENKVIRLLLLDPRDFSLFERLAQTKLAGSRFSIQELHEKAQQLHKKIFVTLVSMYDIRLANRVEIGFYKEKLFSRFEIMDDGIFVVYFVGGEVPSTYLFSRNTLTYDSLFLNFKQNFDNERANCITFDRETPEDYLAEFLEKLGCRETISNLRKQKEMRFERHKVSLISEY